MALRTPVTAGNSNGAYLPTERLATTRSSDGHSRKANVALWTVQGVLAVLFLFAGVSKLVMSGDDLASQTDLPVAFIRFIGVCETAGALGLVLPGLLRIKRGLTPLAAAGLVIIMAGATTVTVAGGDVAPALVPFVVGVLAASVVYRRWTRTHRTPVRPVLQPAA
jgi:uncharacterized membrane protein YphA (DoxX/SURF4 family)